MKKTWIIFSLLLGMIVIGIAGYQGFHSDQSATPEGPQTPNTVAVTRCDVTQTVTAPGNVINTQEITVRMPLGSELTDILVQPGDVVQAGDLLAHLNDADVSLAFAQAQMDIVNDQDTLQKAQQSRLGLNLPRTGDLAIERAKLDLATAGDQLNKAQNDYNNVAGLPADNPRRLSALEVLIAAKDEYYQKLINYNWFTGHPSSQEITAADAKVTLADATLTEAQARWKSLNDLFATNEGSVPAIKSPLSGIVLEVDAQSGETVAEGARLFVLADPTSVEAQVTVTEVDFPYVEIGQSVELFFKALPDANVTGKVSRILPGLAPGQDVLYYVDISLDHVPNKLVAGMTADTSIIIAKRSQVLCLPRALVRASSGPTAIVTVWNGKTTETRKVEIGLRGDAYLEIISGLKEGEKVVTR